MRHYQNNKSYIEITLKHEDFEDFKNIHDDVEIVKQETVHHVVYDKIKVFVEGEVN